MPLQIVRQGVAAWHQRRRQNRRPRPELTEADLRPMV
jgi:hypothetical protein